MQVIWWVGEVRKKNNMILGINASRARSGGAVAHLKGVLSSIDPSDYKIIAIHIWGYKQLLDVLPEYDWLFKHEPIELKGSLLRQLRWERTSLPKELLEANCSILLNVDAGSVCRFSPAVTMSRDMLSYEKGEIERYGISISRLRLIVLRYVQNSSLRFADGVIFLTQYAARVIQNSCGKLENIAFIPHGVGDSFQDIKPKDNWPESNKRDIRCLYVSNADLYKHQWHVVKAIEKLRHKGFNIQLELVGGGSGKARALLESQIISSDPRGQFVTLREFVPQEDLPGYLRESDLFIFASSCENMPNTLVEAMAAGLPIACSSRGPMPEVLKDGGVYFDPEIVESICSAIELLILDKNQRNQVSAKAKELSRQYSWVRCGHETFNFLRQVWNQVK